ncbi:MAG: tetratricopeptide repeat protein, partial [Gallionella sp.]
DEAISIYQHALTINPNNAEAHNNLGYAQTALGQYDKAIESCRRAIVLQPNFAAAYSNLGNSLDALELFKDAIESYLRALGIEPHSAVAHNNLGAIFQKLGQTEEALSYFREALTIQPDTFLYAIQLHLLLPVIPTSVDAISAWRACYEEGIATLLKMAKNGAKITNEQLNCCSFYLAYHNSSDRRVMEALRHFYRICVPDLTFTAPHLANWHHPDDRGQRIKVGFLSEFLTHHTIGSHYKGFIEHLDRSRFEVVVIHSPKAKHDAFRANLDALADEAIALPAKLKDQQQVVAAEQLDVLFYPDIGMSSATYFLAYSRLAPVQATSWGHPDTTGLDTMDYYVAATTNEAEDAQDNYTERLVRLNRLPCYYYKTPPATSPQLSKAELGLPESGTLYGCPQALFKIHPDFDAVLADIALGDPNGHILLPEGTHPDWTALLKARWAATFPILLERVVFMPRMKWDRFMAVMSHMDVLLDPLHFGSGNTFYDAMVIGTPVVTWPGKFGRGRNVAAAYRQMKIADAPIAQRLEEYAPLALALGRDPVRRQGLREASLEAASQCLFEDMQAVREFESFLEDAVVAAGHGEKLVENWSPSIR